MIRIKQKHKLYVALLLCFFQIVGSDVLYAQEPVEPIVRDTLSIAPMDMISLDAADTISLAPVDKVLADSLLMEIPIRYLPDSLVADSIAMVNEENLALLDSITNPELILLSADSIIAAPEIPRKVWVPNPTKSTWLAVVFPGGGQIYNRKYWKLPIIYGGFAGCAYALSWNNKMFKDYSQAYVDIMDGNPNTNSYYDLIRVPEGSIDEATDTRWGPLLKRRKDYYRRYRDISVFAFIGVYLLSIIDAYVDAELSNFDITPDLSMRPTVINDQGSYIGRKSNAVGLQCSFTF